MGWMTGIEPATPGATVQCSTIELHPPRVGTGFAPGGSRTPDRRTRNPSSWQRGIVPRSAAGYLPVPPSPYGRGICAPGARRAYHPRPRDAAGSTAQIRHTSNFYHNNNTPNGLFREMRQWRQNDFDFSLAERTVPPNQVDRAEHDCAYSPRVTENRSKQLQTK